MPQQLRRILLHHDLALEIRSGAESPILMRRTRVTVGAGMKTTTIGIHAPSKRQIRAVVTAQDLPAIVRIERQFGCTGRFKQVAMPRLKWVWRIGDPAHGPILSLMPDRCQCAVPGRMVMVRACRLR